MAGISISAWIRRDRMLHPEAYQTAILAETRPVSLVPREAPFVPVIDLPAPSDGGRKAARLALIRERWTDIKAQAVEALGDGLSSSY